MAASSGLVMMDRVQGERVVNAQGADLGKIDDLVVDLPTGQAVYAILSHGGFISLGDKRFAVPWDMLAYDRERGAFVIDMAEDKLKNAPGFDEASLQDIADPRWAKPLHDYYGSRASWYLHTTA
ncbi:MAG: PRC-barrel domain-containing protein [Stellaceae bacterium]